MDARDKPGRNEFVERPNPYKTAYAIAPQGTVAMANGYPPREAGMTSLKRALLWLVGFPLPIILLIALYLHPG